MSSPTPFSSFTTLSSPLGPIHHAHPSTTSSFLSLFRPSSSNKKSSSSRTKQPTPEAIDWSIHPTPTSTYSPALDSPPPPPYRLAVGNEEDLECVVVEVSVSKKEMRKLGMKEEKLRVKEEKLIAGDKRMSDAFKSMGL